MIVTNWTLHMYWDAYGEEVYYAMKNMDVATRVNLGSNRDEAIAFTTHVEQRGE
jgi:hypothetical protein